MTTGDYNVAIGYDAGIAYICSVEIALRIITWIFNMLASSVNEKRYFLLNTTFPLFQCFQPYHMVRLCSEPFI